jgi:signal transduction histidine kinase
MEVSKTTVSGPPRRAGSKPAAAAHGTRKSPVAAGAPLPASLLSHWPGVVFRQRPDFTFEAVSPRIEALTGVPADAWLRPPASFWDVVHELDADEVRQHIRRCAEARDGLQSSYRVRNLQTGRIAYLAEFRQAVRDAQGRVTAYDGFWLDVTRQTIAEMRLANAAWKETLAVLTMGLAHDFNNIMAGIASLSDSFLAQIEGGHPFHEGLTLISQNAHQASQLVHRILHLHRGKTGNRGYHDLNEIIRDTVELLRKVIPRRIEIASELAPGQLPLYVDAVEFRQVIINLALNAADAMPDRGRLRFATARHASFPPLAHVKGVRPRLPCCSLTVADNGCGIKAHQLDLIFDPFFTTKTMNKGSGLGLYNARLFVERHHGAISVESAEGAGATFGVWLPEADFTEADQAAAPAARRRRCVLLTGQPGKALDSMAEFLRLNNYHVFVVTGAAEEWLQSDEYHFDGVIVQVAPQALAGHSLVAFVRKQQLPLKVILQVVGCHQDELETQFVLKADLILTPDMAEAVLLEKLQAAFESPAEAIR